MPRKNESNEPTRESGLTRRKFLRTTAMGIGGFLVLETLTVGCGTSTSKGDVVNPGDIIDQIPDDVFKNFPLEFTEKTVPTTCWIGKQDCGMLARVVSQTFDGQKLDRLVKLEGNPDHPLNLGTLCPKGSAQVQAIYDYNRVKTPLRRTNAKGVAGKFKQITWAEALDEVQAQMKDAADNKKAVLWQKGRSKAGDFYDDAFVKALGSYVSTTKMGHGAYCSDSGYRACEYTIGYHGVLMPDFEHTEYLLSWGWGLTTSGGNKYCWLTWPQKLLAARESGKLKRVVCLDPNRRQTGPHAEEWLPNRPGTDLAFFLGIANYLVNNTATNFANGLIDETYLKKYSNATSLVRHEGAMLTVNGKEQVWDTTSQSLKDFDAAGITPALLGEYDYQLYGSTFKAKTAFQVFKEHLAKYTPEWADGVTDLPKGTVARIASELFSHAHIGETVDVGGVSMPYRPVSIMAYHVSQQEQGFQAMRACLNVVQLLGAIDVPGGTLIDFAPGALYKNWKALDEIEIKNNDLAFHLGGSKFFPISSANPSFFHRATLDPKKYDVKESTIPKKCITHHVEPAVSFADSRVIKEAYKQFEHVTCITPWIGETADLFADLILPAATLEKYEGPYSAKTFTASAKALRVPPIAPLWESKGEIDIYLDICEKLGILTKYLETVNKELSIELATDKKPTPREIFDVWAKSIGETGIDFFEKSGVTKTKAQDATKMYSWAKDYYGARHRLYGASLLRYQQHMKGTDVGQLFYQDYTALPTWREPTMWGSIAAGYDLCLLSHKQVEFKQSRASFVPMLAELSNSQGLMINPETAKKLGLVDGDEIWVESHNAVTKETRQLKTRAVLRNVIRPDTVSLSHHYGLSISAANSGQGPSPNNLYFGGEGYVQCTQDASFHVMVKVTKA